MFLLICTTCDGNLLTYDACIWISHKKAYRVTSLGDVPWTLTVSVFC